MSLFQFSILFNRILKKSQSQTNFKFNLWLLIPHYTKVPKKWHKSLSNIHKSCNNPNSVNAIITIVRLCLKNDVGFSQFRFLWEDLSNLLWEENLPKRPTGEKATVRSIWLLLCSVSGSHHFGSCSKLLKPVDVVWPSIDCAATNLNWQNPLTRGFRCVFVSGIDESQKK